MIASPAQTSVFTLAACAEMLFRGLPMVERVRRLDALGFEVEIWDRSMHDIAALGPAYYRAAGRLE